jgi:hypothetical protein
MAIFAATFRLSKRMRAATVVLAAFMPLLASAQTATPGWINQDANWPANKQLLQAFGERFKDSDSMFQQLKQAAKGGQKLTWQQMDQPAYNWSGIFTRTKGGLQFDPDLGPTVGPDSAKLTPAGRKVVQTKAEALKKTGGEYDPLSDCRPPGTPRWFSEPFLHEFIVTPNQTWLVNEMVNDVRRVYTDGRAHTALDDAYPTPNGDTIGFWDGSTLVTQTKYLMSGQYQRGVQPNFSEQVTLVERWHKVDDKTVQADVWVFDPVNLAAPWYTRQSWTKLSNDEYLLRIRYWDCRENKNNDIVITDKGTSQFSDFDFVKDDAAVSSDATVKKGSKEPANTSAPKPAQPK